MSVIGWTAGMALATAGLAFLGGSVATDLTRYGAVSNETAAIYTYQEAMLESGGSYASDLDLMPTSEMNQRTILAASDSYAMVIQIPTGEIYLSTSSAPNPLRVSGAEGEVLEIPVGLDGAVIASTIDGYATQALSAESDFDRTKREATASFISWLVSINPPHIPSAPSGL